MGSMSNLTGARAVTADGHHGVVVKVARHGRVVHVRLETGIVIRTRIERLHSLAPVASRRAA